MGAIRIGTYHPKKKAVITEQTPMVCSVDFIIFHGNKPILLPTQRIHRCQDQHGSWLQYF